MEDQVERVTDLLPALKGEAFSCKRMKGVKDEVEKRKSGLENAEGVSTIGTFKSDEDLQSFIRKKQISRESQ